MHSIHSKKSLMIKLNILIFFVIFSVRVNDPKMEEHQRYHPEIRKSH